MSSLKDRMAALAAGDVVEVPGTPQNRVGGETARSGDGQTISPSQIPDRRVSLG